jgi:putative Mg2+ transporter-C (MgtC) family protein
MTNATTVSGRILITLEAELSDVPNIEGVTKVVFRLLLAAILGGVLGYDREVKGKAAGFRTHMLVAVGAAFFVLVPSLNGMSSDGISRVLQGLVAGIGFLGAGAIIKSDNESNVRGLTTAAGLWLTAAIGVAAGLGRDVTALLGTGVALLILAVVPRLERRA